MAIKFKKGQRINQLVVLEDEYSFSKGDANGNNIRRYWHCLCDCGNETYISASALKSGRTKSCGCLTKQRIIETSRKDETGNRYGKLVVMEYAYTKDNKSYWRCQCDCGNIIEVSGPNLRTGNTISCGKCKRTSLGEIKIQEILIQMNVDFAREVRFSDCRDKQPLPFDFAIYYQGRMAALIEYQGKQHYEPTGGWSDKEHLCYVQRHDNIKKEWAQNNGIPLYEISYQNISELQNIIESIITKIRQEHNG